MARGEPRFIALFSSAMCLMRSKPGNDDLGDLQQLALAFEPAPDLDERVYVRRWMSMYAATSSPASAGAVATG